MNKHTQRLSRAAGIVLVALMAWTLAAACGGAAPEKAPESPAQPAASATGDAAAEPAATTPGQAASPALEDGFNTTPAALPGGAAASPSGSPAPGGNQPGSTLPSGNPPGTAPAVAPPPADVPALSPGPAPGATAAKPPAAPSPGATPPAADVQRKLGELVYAEGSVTIHRAGASPERGDIGSIVRVYDVLVTGPKSRAEVDIGAGSAGGASIKLAENTAFYFDTKELSGESRKTILQLLSGAVAVKVDKLANGSFSIGTDQAVLGVRGTVFIVDTVPDGSMLVTCETGAVAIRADGSTATAKPGTAVVLPEAGSPGTVAVEPSGLGAYRSGWRTDAYAGFASRAISYTSTYAAALQGGKPAFDAAFQKLKAQKPALDAWRSARAAGKVPRMTDWIAEKKAVSAALFDCLKALFSIERPYYRLVELKALHAAGTGTGTLKDGTSSAAYFAGFDAANARLILGMAQVREALSLFFWVSAGSPLGEFFGSKAESLGTGSLFLED